MKKKIFVLLMTLFCLVCAFTLVACDEGNASEGGAPAVCQHRDANDDSKCDKCNEAYTDGRDVDDDEPEHTHSMTRHAAVPATCTATGNIEYWECSACNKYFSNSAATAEITNKSSVILAAKNHANTLTRHAPVAATCTTSGNIEYWSCSACNKYFSNSAATAEITDKSSVTLSPTYNHTFTAKSTATAYVQSAPTCQSVGVYYYKCTTCAARGSQTYNGDSVADHSFTSKTQTVPYFKSAANCESPALYYYKCQWCNTKGEETYTVGSEQHDFTARVQTSDYLKSEANCQSAAIYYFKCTLCDDHGTSTYKVGTKTKHALDANHICTTCSNAYIYFGEYPQTIKADDVSITSTTDSRGYFLGSDGAYYAKVTADPSSSSYTFSNGSAVTDGTVYYFKVEPIRWRILSQSNVTALILCDSIIANKAFDSSSNNYAESDIRAWLNDQFYNTAFTALEQELILTTTVDNSVASTGKGSTPYACENTNDKVFLLSYAEVTNSAYGFSTSHSTYDTARRMQTSDYSRATGASMNTSTDYGNGDWWLRSPCSSYYENARFVCDDGSIYYFYYYHVRHTDYGVVPALQIRLSVEPDDPLYTVDPDDPTKIYFGEYPQTIKADDVTITETTDSRGYYLGSDGAHYAKVTADPYSNSYTFSNGSAVTDGTVYYFKVEPIRWRILSQSNGTALILCDSIIANKAFDSSSNNYAESDIRAWLNDQFYNTAFTALEQELILTTTVDNSVASTGDSSNPNACENTNDKVFLLSCAEATNSVYGFSTSTSRQMQTSDYSRAAGAYTNTFTDYYGNGWWWLRSPNSNLFSYVRLVNCDGNLNNFYGISSNLGVVPALQIRL